MMWKLDTASSAAPLPPLDPSSLLRVSGPTPPGMDSGAGDGMMGGEVGVGGVSWARPIVSIQETCTWNTK